ncbi:MAG: sugar phosphate isomerase/epimerase family protein [Oscillospiraceae bacterium]
MMIPGVRAHDYGRQTPENLFAAIKADGWQTVQLACKKALSGIEEVSQLTPPFVEEVKAALAQSGLSVGVLGAYVELSFVEEEARRAEVEQFCSQLPVAKALGAGCIGSETTGMEKQPGVKRADALKALRRSLWEILPLAEQQQVAVAVEPVYTHAMATPEDVRALLADMQSPWLRVIFDPVNLLSPGEVAGQTGLWSRAFECFGPQIAAVHMKGVRPQNGGMQSVGFAQSVVEYGFVFEQLRRLPQPLPVLREEANPADSRQDLAFLQKCIDGRP